MLSGHFTAEVPLRSSTRPQRRQNTSCDPCRRSKRRCFFPQNGLDASAICTHCRRLGHSCTFNFAASQQSSRPKKRHRRNSPRSNSRAIQSNSYSQSASSDVFADLADNTRQTGTVDGQDDFAAWLNFDIDHCFGDNLILPSTGESNTGQYAISHSGSTSTPEIGNESQISRLPDRSHALQSFPKRADAIFMSTIRSPIYLLNSKMDTRILDERLIRIFDTIVTGSAKRFLDYDCNLYATGSRYQIECSNLESSRESSPADCNALINGAAVESPIPSPQPSANPALVHAQDSRVKMRHAIIPGQNGEFKMTLLGCARFLDHFGDFYGNRLSPDARRRSDTALKSVFRAFALQWLPNNSSDGAQSARNTSLEIYTDAWHQARSALNDAHSVRSFRVVFACLMFNGIVIPTSAQSHAIAHEFLDSGLRNLRDLDGLVKQYCTTLGPFSKYAALTEASLSLVRWCGYLRDTGAALFGDHQCRLPDPFVYSNAFTSDDSAPMHPVYHNLKDLDMNVPMICRKASAEAFCVWRQIINVKNALLKNPDDAFDPTSETFVSGMETLVAIGKFDETFRHFLNNCRESFHDLSISSRIASVSLMAFWDLGVLILAEVFQPPTENPLSDLASRIQAYRKDATSSIAQTIEYILKLPMEEEFNLQNGLSAEVPLIAYHVTPSLMATALEKAVEHIIDMRISQSYNQGPAGNTWDLDHEAWIHQVDVLMKGLLSLDVTVGGSQTAGVAFQSLMRKYGDIISETWTSDFDT